MTLPDRPTYSSSSVTIGAPDPAQWRQIIPAHDVTDALDWFTAALEREDIHYFGIFYDSQPIGQILLHDIDPLKGESLIAYHIFDPQQRGRGIGTQALRLLQQYVAEQTDLTKLVIITSRDNAASQAIARKCGFIETGTPREDPLNGVLFTWGVPR